MSKSTKLTLSMPSEILRQAKQYARVHKTSISAIVARLFESLYEARKPPKGEPERGTLFTKSSIGMISLPKQSQKWELIAEAVSEKYRKK